MTKPLAIAGVVLALGATTFAALQFQPTPAQPTTVSETAATSAMVAVKQPAAHNELAQLGKRAFEATCATCHVDNAAGQDGVAPPLVHKIYEPGHHSDMAFFMAVDNGVRAHHWAFGNMPPVAGLTKGDVKAIVAYVRELQRENGIF
ncbi:c-type cytochrome [Shimia sagamensis]|uniref:Cytochrome C oxidase, cbb3-type, subunit III n=1 Tax=Shimia sagamensis TaxID=1566352 RepID=A0ABY1P4A9_9RHOB|nr:c-type cytochrome [Shimia sagamensis]SMP23680.1 Cytochrome C oxidase, cbb3-type, subunit III [Shimia sagamensis]